MTTSGVSSLLSVSLETVDMQTIGSDEHNNGSEEEIGRSVDALCSRLKIAQFIAKTLSQRLEELQNVLTRVKQSSPSSPTTDSWGSAPKTPPNAQSANLPDVKFKKDILSRPSPPSLIRRHTTTAIQRASPQLAGDTPTSLGWEERAAAFMLKRHSQRTAMEHQHQHHHQNQQQSQDAQQHNPVPPGGMRHPRRVSHGSEAKPPRSPQSASDSAGRPFLAAPDANKHPHPQQQLHNQKNTQNQNSAQDQDVLWELERRRQNPRRDALLAAAWTTYQDSWENLNMQIDKADIQPYLTFATVPWPVLRTSSDPPLSNPNEIGIEEMKEFVLSPFHSAEKSKESRIREACMRWHTDKSARWLELVVESERARVKEGVERVNWCLGNLK